MRKLILVLVLGILLFGCTTKISDLKDEKNVGNSYTLSGTVEKTIKIGSLSGYTLRDDTGAIGISSESLPKEGDKVTISGVLIKDSLFGYYIKVTSQ